MARHIPFMAKSGPFTARKSLFAAVLFCGASFVLAQSLGNTGTIDGVVTDPSGAAIPQATVNLHNNVTGYMQTTESANDGTFHFKNIPPNTYHLEVTVVGFATFSLEVAVTNALPIPVKVAMKVASATTTVEVEGAAEALETDPSAHADVDRNQMLKLPLSDPGAGLSSVITLSTGAVVSESNGQFHPSGDHAQVTYDVDGMPISDQQSKVFSTQLPVSAIQSMEIITGTPQAEFGDKSSLVAQITTRSGLGQNRLTGTAEAQYGSFGTAGGNFGLGWGTNTFGNFFAVEGVRSGRFLDSPEFTPFHDIGNNTSLFDRVDFQPSARDALHFNLFAARNWIQIPNDYDQLFQDQRQRVLTWSIAPGYQHTFSATTLLTINPYIRKDQVNYYPSRDLFNDIPATQSQQRQLLNWGVKADIATTKGRHNFKYGIDLKQTRLLENF